jgi:hypothetical protein
LRRTHSPDPFLEYDSTGGVSKNHTVAMVPVRDLGESVGANHQNMFVHTILNELAGGGNVWNSVAGIYTDASGSGHGFVESNGSYTSFDYPGASFTEGTGINALGVVVGIFTDSAGNTHGFIRTP